MSVTHEHSVFELAANNESRLLNCYQLYFECICTTAREPSSLNRLLSPSAVFSFALGQRPSVNSCCLIYMTYLVCLSWIVAHFCSFHYVLLHWFWKRINFCAFISTEMQQNVVKWAKVSYNYCIVSSLITYSSPTLFNETFHDSTNSFKIFNHSMKKNQEYCICLMIPITQKSTIILQQFITHAKVLSNSKLWCMD